MEKTRVSDLCTVIKHLEQSIDRSTARKLQLDKCVRIVKEVHSHSNSCEECYRILIDLEEAVSQLVNLQDFDQNAVATFARKLKAVTSHLSDKHFIKSGNYYLSILLPFGIVLGVTIGLFILEHIWLGLAMGVAIGISMGVGFDAEHKRKGLTY